MPKRLIDGDSLYTSNKLLKVSPKYRAEYAWLLPLALANGVCEANPRLILQQAYTYNRDDITLADITAMLDEFEAAEMVARFDAEGKRWLYFVGIESRLPKPSERLKMKKGPAVPSAILQRFAIQGREDVATMSPSGIGNGSGSGSGFGSGLGNGKGKGIDAGSNAAGTTLSSSLSSQRHTETETSNNEPRKTQFRYEKAALKEMVELLIEFLFDKLTDRDDVVIPAGYPKLWGGDFEAALQTHSFENIQKAIAVSQLPKNKQYYVRAKSICENLDSLLERAEKVSLETLLTATKKSPPQGGNRDLGNCVCGRPKVAGDGCEIHRSKATDEAHDFDLDED